VVIVDNASTDDTLQIAKRIGDVVVTCLGALGECARPGVLQAKGDAVFFMDVDQRMLAGTVASAIDALSGFEAVVVPERPSQVSGLFNAVLEVERTWAEVSGLALPRMFWRDIYLAYRVPVGTYFGEDRAIAKQVAKMALSRVPILHIEPESVVALLRKYRRYGRRHRGGEGTTEPIARAVLAYAMGVPKLRPKHIALLPMVVPLKVAKAIVFYQGMLAAGSR
jgi:glycosyltransferase involved in cell wall biosynthesis